MQTCGMVPASRSMPNTSAGPLLTAFLSCIAPHSSAHTAISRALGQTNTCHQHEQTESRVTPEAAHREG